MSSTAHSYLRSNEAAPARPQAERTLGADLDNIFRLARADRVAPPPAEPRRVSQPDLDAALDMLNRAARAMDMLQTRYHEVESYARDVADRAERDLSAAHGHVKEWEARAAAGEDVIEDLRKRLTDADRRTEQAERRAEAAERRTEEAERLARNAEQGSAEVRQWLESFYGKIVAAFESRPLPKPAVE